MVGAAALTVCVGVVGTSSVAGATNLTPPCQGSGTSVDKHGSPIDSATAPGHPKGDRGTPFLVDYDGKVNYQGGGPLMLNHHWHVDIFGVQVKSGGSPNGTHQTNTSGHAKVSDYLPFKVAGEFHVTGGISGQGGRCSGGIWVKLAGSPVGTIPWIVGIALVALGALGVLASFPDPRGP